MTKKVLYSMLFMCFGSLALAQETQEIGTLVTDRPDQTESASIVEKTYLQVETGFAYETFERNNVRKETTTLNTTLLRYGLLDNLELRLGWDMTQVSNNFTTNKLSGFSPMLLGVKIGISEEKNGMPQIAFLGHINMPFLAGKDFKPNTTSADFRFSLAHTLNEKSSLSYNLGMAWEGDNPEANYVYTLAYGYSLSDKFGAYAELYGDFPENSKANHLWDAGITYLINKNVQLDATIGSSITEGQDFMVSAGVSFRIPTK